MSSSSSNFTVYIKNIASTVTNDQFAKLLQDLNVDKPDSFVIKKPKIDAYDTLYAYLNYKSEGQAVRASKILNNRKYLGHQFECTFQGLTTPKKVVEKGKVTAAPSSPPKQSTRAKKKLPKETQHQEKRVLQFSSPLAIPYVKSFFAPKASSLCDNVQWTYHSDTNTIELFGHNSTSIVDLMRVHLSKVKAIMCQTANGNRTKLEEFGDISLKDEYFDLSYNFNNRDSIWVTYVGSEQKHTLLKNYLMRVKLTSNISEPSVSFSEHDVVVDYSSDSDMSVSSVSVASELNLGTDLKEDVHHKKVRLMVQERWNSEVQKELDRLLEKWPTVQYSIQKSAGNKGWDERYISMTSPMKSDVEEYCKAVMKLFPNKSLKLSAERIKLVKDSKPIQDKVNKLKVNIIFSKQGLGFYGIGSKGIADAIELVNKFLDEKDVKTEVLKFSRGEKSRMIFIKKFIMPKSKAFKVVSIKDEESAFKIKGKRTAVEKVLKELKEVRKKIIVKQLGYEITDSNASSFVRKQLQRKFEEIQKGENTELIFKMKDSKDSGSRVAINITCMDSDLMDEIDQMVQSICRESTSDTIQYARDALEKVNRLSEKDFNEEWGVEIFKHTMKIFIRGLSQEDVANAKEALMAILHSTSSQTIVKVYCRLFIRTLMRKEDVEQIAAKYKAKFFANKLKHRDVDSIMFKADKKHVQDITRDIEKLKYDIQQSINREQVILSKIEHAALKAATDQLYRILSKSQVELVQAKNGFVSKASTSEFSIALKCVDITKLKVASIVNAANVELNHAGGIAKVIADAAGPDCIKECIQYIQQHGNLTTGAAMTTSSGKLKRCEKIIHVVGPIWSGGLSNEDFLLNQAIMNALREAEKSHLWGVAIPAVSAGIYGFPLERCLAVITKAVFEFVEKEKPQHLKACYLVHQDKKVIPTWRTVFRAVAHENPAFTYVDSSFSDNSDDDNDQIKSTTPESSTTSHQEYCWYYVDDDNEWKSYIPSYNKMISKAFHERKKNFQLAIGNKTYEIDFDRETQKNTETNFERKLQRTLPTQYSWSWIDDRRVEQQYSLENAAKIEQGYQQRQQYILINLSRMLDDLKQDYFIIYDYQNGNHIQQNCGTKFQRQMMRREVEYTPPAAIEEYTTTTTSQEVDKIYTIDLLGRTPNIQKAKDALSELFKKVIAVRKLNMTKISQTLPAIQELLKDINEVEVIEIKEDDDTKCFALHGVKDQLDAAENVVLHAESQQSGSIKYPKHWITQTENCKLVPLDSSNQEYIHVCTRMSETLPQCQVIKVERVQNRWLWKKYVNQRELIEMKNGGDSNEQYLFHGTKSTPPKQIYEDEVGFDMRHSLQGLWGRGCYFAKNSSYSGGVYAHTLSSANEKQMFLAKVAVGDAIQMREDNKITMPPVKNTGVDIAHSIRYDAVNSLDGNIFIIYENSRAYPEYLITFK